MEFDWAHTWLGDGRRPTLEEGQAQGLICQVFFLLLFLVLVFGSHHPASDLGFNGYLVSSILFFRVYDCYNGLTPLSRRWSIYDVRPTDWRLKASSE